MGDEVQYITPEGKLQLERELKELLEVKRPALAAKLQEAIKMGDLSENADYIDAKEQQGFLEGQIREIENTLRYAVVIEDSGPKGVVSVGNEVTIQEEGEDEPETYRIVGAAEADPAHGRISNESPLGRALLNKRKGDKVRVEAPGGESIFKIIAVK
ncbi:MAG: transcription elongation factor GreA [Anaerolineae bacterium]|nr:transcription elongation factor GreA [Anaerolineae bacterium]